MQKMFLRSYRQEYDWCYYRRDHLGNNVAVWNATEDSTVQRTFYYASGLPMSCSTGQATQPIPFPNVCSIFQVMVKDQS